MKSKFIEKYSFSYRKFNPHILVQAKEKETIMNWLEAFILGIIQGLTNFYQSVVPDIFI